MKKYSLFLFLFIGSLSAMAQNNIALNGFPQCGFSQVLHKAGVDYSQLSEIYKKNLSITSAGERLTGTSTVYDIPVVFHIIYAASEPSFNLPDSIITNQIDVLNKAYRKQHADTGKTRMMFKPLSEDAFIQFHLATTDPSGNPTTGITRTISTHTYFGSSSGDMDSMERVKSTANGGIDPWPTDKYLNIWVANLSDAQGQITVLGYGVPPLNPLPGNWDPADVVDLSSLTDGVVIQPHAVGSNNLLNSQLQGLYSKGRATVHEVGHYLGLQHVFGSTDGSNSDSCGKPIQSDGIDDTPEQSTISFTTGCPSLIKNSCGFGPTDSLDLWEDYMDYTTDACQTLFTKDQIAVMRNVLANQRASLFVPASVNNVMVLSSNAIYPNPTTDRLSVSYTGVIEKVTIINFIGQTVLQFNASQANTKSYDVSSLNSGNYLLLLTNSDNKHVTGKFAIIRE